MKKINKLVVLLFLLLVIQLFSNKFSKNIIIKGDLSYKEFYITEDIYENSKNNLDGIRIVDKKGNEVPYVIENEKVQIQRNEKIISTGKVIDRITKKEKIEFIIQFSSKNNMEDLIGNVLEVVPTKNFYSEYELFGSNNSKNWDKITSGDIYKTPEKENLIISFLEKRYEYYKITMPIDKGNTIEEAVLKYIDSKSSEIKNIETKLEYNIEQKDKNTIIKIKSKYMPLKNIVLDIDGEFQRSYLVGSKDYFYSEGVISKVGNKKNLVINLAELPKIDEIVIEIKNGDNAPLKIKNIIGVYTPDKIVFSTNENGDYKIVFGDENLNKPEYDLENFIDEIKDRDLVVLEGFNKEKEQIAIKPKDYSIYYNIFIGIVVVLLILFIVKKLVKSNN